MTTNEELLAELQLLRGAVERSNEVLAGKASRRALLMVAGSVALSLAVGIGGIAYAVNEDHNTCVRSNAGRVQIREIVEDSMVASAEAIIAVAEDAEPAVIEQYRTETRRRAEEITSQLKDREC
jgi:hypothetical protein